MIILLIIVCVQIIIYLFPQWYLSELALSFFPYRIIINILLLIYVLLTRFVLRKKILLIGFYSVLSVFYSIIFFQTYDLPISSSNTQNSGQSLTILYANILEDNLEYTGIINTIQSYDPDVVMFVEFADHHDTHLKSFFAENYPYINRTTRSQKFVGSVVFSKYPIESVPLEFPSGMWRYGLFKIKYDQLITGNEGGNTLKTDDLYVYLVHTSSPSGLQYFDMRNIQLSRLVSDIQSHDLGDQRNILMLGDFNVSPWSWYYKKYLGSLIGLQNHTFISPLFSWRSHYFPLLWSHIDHVFTDQNTHISQLQTVSIPGSDHRGLFFRLQVED